MIITRLIGGLGNQMFQYATGRAVAYNNICKLDISIYKKYKIHNGYRLNSFKIKEEFATDKEISFLGVNKRIFIKLARMGIYKKDTLYVEKERDYTKFNDKVFSYKNLYLSGCWQNENYFLRIRDILIQEFTLKVNISDNANDYLHLIKDGNSISVHVRRGDYLKTNKSFKMKDGWFIGVDYYKNAVEYIKTKVKNPHFFIFSDDIEWCKKNLNFIKNPIFVENTSNELEDFALMKYCKYNIIPNSSFSWWAAWLNENKDKIVIAPKVWFKHRDGFDPVPDSWVKL
jgi:hypothetical protein